MLPNVEVHLRARRRSLGLTQQELADRVALSRQAVNAIESGGSIPGAEVALRLARALACRVEDLFQLSDAAERLVADYLGPPPAHPQRVALAWLTNRWLARPLTHLDAAADGLALPASAGQAQVELLAAKESLAGTIFGVGCDPAMGVLSAHLARATAAGGGPRLRWFQAGSTAALAAVARGEAHLAGSHLLDSRTETYNVAPAAALLAAEPATIVTFAHWEEGLILAHGNPMGIRAIADLGRPEVRLVNREEGSGSRLLLDAQLRQLGIGPKLVRGYDRLASGHLAVAGAIASGAADVGLGIRAAAVAEGLEFLPLREERFDLVIPNRHLEHPTVVRLMESLRSATLVREIEALPGYDPREMGCVVATVGPA
jgi:molybdate-binding protein/DNA-binding XRE family transcriptional regulator